MSGVEDGIVWWRDTFEQGSNLGFDGTWDKKHLVELTIPASKFPENELTIGFKAETSKDLYKESAGVDNIKITAHYDCAIDERRHLSYATSDVASSCKRDMKIVSETFEYGATPGWSVGVVAMDDDVGHFLGRLGKENNVESKVFEVPSHSDSALLEFSVYSFGEAWTSSDEFHLKIGIADLHLGDFSVASSQGSEQGISWSRVVDSDSANHHHVTVEIPLDYYLNGKLSLSFEVVMSEAIAKKSAGIDNLMISARGVDTCRGAPVAATSSGFSMGGLKNAAEPGMDGDDGESKGYCSSADFPCGDEEGMVHVCHYSLTSGYVTYCLKEADSILVRSYPDDYCGPCVGGYGQQMKDASP